MLIDTPTSELTVKASRQRTWLPFGFASEVIIEGIVKKFRLPEIIDASLHIFWPRLGPELVDLKGCDSARGRYFSPLNNQLMQITGTIPLESGKNEGFSLSFETPFKAFSGTHHVVHSLQPDLSNELLNSVPIQKLGRIFPIKVEAYRFGIERFKSRRAFSMLGFVPTVCDGFNLEVRDQRIRLLLFSDNLKTANQELFEAGWFSLALNELSANIFGLPWEELLKNKDSNIR